MTTQDISLLTEQDRDDIAGIKEHIDASYSQECADRLASALIAARAENKRKDEAIALFLEHVNMVGVDANGMILVRPSAITYFDKLRALLQSEKEAEADADIAAGRVKSFDNMDDLIADLDSPKGGVD